MARSTLEILLDSILQRADDAPAEDLPRLPQRPLSRAARLPSPSRRRRRRSSRAPPRLPSDQDLLSSASCRNDLHGSSGPPYPRIAAGGSQEERIRVSVHLAITQEALDQGLSIAERKTENGSHVTGHWMDEQLSAANGSSDDDSKLLFSARDDRDLPIHWDGNGVSTDHTLLDANGPTITQESSGEATISTSSDLEMKGKSSPAPKGSEGMGMHEGDPFQPNGKNSSVQTRTEDMAVTEDDTMQGRRVWFLNHDSRWTPGILHSTCGMEAMVSLQDGQVVRLQSNRLLPANPDILDDVDDIVQLSYINEPSILHTLRQRYEIGKSYTRSGSVSIAITSSTKQVTDNGNGLLAQESRSSHVYAVAIDAFKAMKRDGMNQSIILGGMNNAEQSAIMKLVLQNLASHGGNPVLEKVLLSAHRILEAFAHVEPSSKTTGNCVGEMINLFYDDSGALLGAELRIALLEELRVVHRDKGEQTYNIFYQLCEGADSVLKDKLKLMGSGEFSYLNKMPLVHTGGINYHSQFQSVIDSLYAFAISSQEQEHIFTMLAAILWLGNITQPSLHIESQALGNAASLLQCSKEQLQKALSPVTWDSVEATAVRDLLSQLIYERLFWWVVRRINKVLKSGVYGNSKSINIVNMPSCGPSQRKGVDALLSNYCHEYLHLFIRYHLSRPEREESICGEHRIGLAQDNVVVEFLEQVLFPLLEDVSNGAESGFTCRLQTLIDNTNCCKQKNLHEFSIGHIFGEVTYDATYLKRRLHDNFVRHKNFQTLNPCVPQMPDITEENDMEAHHSRIPINKQSNSDGTFSAGCQIQEWVQQVLEHLKNSSPLPILCIMPSKHPLKNLFEEELVLEQLRLHRLTDIAIKSRTHYWEQISHELFASRFGVFVARHVATDEDPLGICIGILQRFNVPPYMYCVGLRNLFFYPGQVDKLEQACEKHVRHIVALQKTYRGYKVRSSFKRQKEASIYLQATIRGWLSRKSIADQAVEKNAISRPSEDHGIQGHDNTEIEEHSFFVPTVKANGNGVAPNAEEDSDVDDGLQSICTRKEDMEDEKEQLLASLRRKEAENGILQLTIKEYKRKWSACEGKMKSMEELWTKQIDALQKSLSAAKAVVEERCSWQDQDTEGDNSSVHLSSHESVERNTADQRESDTRRSVLDPSRSVLGQLSKELEHRAEVFNDDARFLVEVKSGQIEANFKPEAELQRLKLRFEKWRKDFKDRLRETKNMLKKLGKSEPTEKKRKKKWWSRW